MGMEEQDPNHTVLSVRIPAGRIRGVCRIFGTTTRGIYHWSIEFFVMAIQDLTVAKAAVISERLRSEDRFVHT